MAVVYPERGSIPPLAKVDRLHGSRQGKSPEEAMLDAFERSLTRLTAALSPDTNQHLSNHEINFLKMTLSSQLTQAEKINFFPVGTPAARRILGIRSQN